MPRIAVLNTNTQKGPVVGIYSYGSKVRKEPIAAQFEFDVSTFRDPAGQKQFNGMDGRFSEVKEWIAKDSRVAAVVHQCMLLADDLVKPKPREISGQVRSEPVSTWLSLSFVDHHGKWSSPAVAEIVADTLDRAGYTVYLAHHTFKTQPPFNTDTER